MADIREAQHVPARLSSENETYSSEKRERKKDVRREYPGGIPLLKKDGCKTGTIYIWNCRKSSQGNKEPSLMDEITDADISRMV